MTAGRRGVRASRLSLLTLLVMLATAACGKKGPPLPPLLLLPAPPPELTAVRRGSQVDLSFRIPRENTDRSTPADLSRVEIYALTASGAVSADDVVRRGAPVGTLLVEKPKDPDEPEPKKSAPEKPAPTRPAPESHGRSQGDSATFSDVLTGADDADAHRTYVAVGYTQRGRRGPLSARVAVPLVPPPAAPPQPDIAYDEKAITVSWASVPDSDSGPYSYSVYRRGTSSPVTTSPIPEPTFTDTAVVWEQERCYDVRAGSTLEDVRVEGAASPVRCVTPRDTFAPATPDGLVSVASEGAVSLIWSPNREPDLAGYFVLRAIAPATELTPVSATPITDTNFKDTVPGGARVTYAVQAVDKAGNRSEPSNATTETAR